MAWGFWRWFQGRLDQAPSAAARQPASVRLQLADCVRIPGSSVDGVAITHQRTLTQPWEHSGCFETGFGPLGLTALAIAPVAAPAPAGRCGCGRGSPSHRQPARSSPSSPGPPPGPALLDAMAAVAEGIATTALAAAHQQCGWLIQPQLIGHPPATEVGAIAEPTVAAAAAAAELMQPGRQIQRLRARGGGCGLRHQRRCCCGWNPKGDLVGRGERINHPVDGPMRAVAESLLRPGEPAHTSRQGGALPGEACWLYGSLTPHPARTRKTGWDVAGPWQTGSELAAKAPRWPTEASTGKPCLRRFASRSHPQRGWRLDSVPQLSPPRWDQPGFAADPLEVR
jgi:hypothetical protein